MFNRGRDFWRIHKPSLLGDGFGYRGRLADSDSPDKNSRRAENFGDGSGPVAAVFLVVVFGGLNASTATGIVVAAWVFVLAAVGRRVGVKKIFLGAFDLKMTLNICCILYFIQVLDVTEVLSEIVAAFQASPLPIPVIIACVSLIIGILTGMSQGHVAIVMPIVAAMGTGDLNLAGVAMAFGVAGQMLTPTHVCLIVTIDYFKADLLGTLKPILFCEILILTIFSIYTYLTW